MSSSKAAEFLRSLLEWRLSVYLEQKAVKFCENTPSVRRDDSCEDSSYMEKFSSSHILRCGALSGRIVGSLSYVIS